MLKKLSLATALVLAMTSGAFAVDGAAVYTDKGCNACHGADGKSPIMGTYPKIAGQNADYTAQQLKDFKSGARSNSQAAQMMGIMSAVSDEEIAAVSTYLSGL